MLRSNQLCMTSMIRDSTLSHASYDIPEILILSTSDIYSNHAGCFPLLLRCCFHALVVNNVIQAKQKRRMPEIKKPFQKSENSVELIFTLNRMFGGLVLASLAGFYRSRLAFLVLKTFRDCIFLIRYFFTVSKPKRLHSLNSQETTL